MENSFGSRLSGLPATPNEEYVFQYWVDGNIRIGDPYADKVADPYGMTHSYPPTVHDAIPEL